MLFRLCKLYSSSPAVIYFKIDSAAITRDRGKLTHIMYFPSPISECFTVNF